MMKRMTKRVITVALLMFFALTYVFAGTEWMFVEAFTPVYYLEDVVLFQGGSEKEAREACEKQGYKFVPYDLNAGTSTGEYIYLGYKTTTNKDFAITSLAMLGMNSGYQLRDYKEMAKMLENKNTEAAETMADASAEMARLYAAGSPKAKDACECLNLYSVDEEGEQMLGDYIVSGAADTEFYQELILKASGGTVTSVMNFLNTGIAPAQAVYDEQRDVIAGTWADAAANSEMWDTILSSDSDLISTDQKNEMHRLYDDDARKIFPKLQEFTTNYMNAKARQDINGDPEIDEQYQSEDNSAVEACADHMGDMKVDETDSLYLGAYDMLNHYELPDGEGLGEYIVDLGLKTSEEIDITELYPIVSSMSEGQAGIIGTSGFIEGVYNVSETVSVFESDPELLSTLEETKQKILDFFGNRSVWIWTTSQDELYKSNVAITNDAVRRQAAEDSLARTSGEEFDENWMLIQKYISIISGCISVGAIVIGKLLVWAIPKVASWFIGTAAAAAAAKATVAFITSIISYVSTFLFWAGIVVLIIQLVIYIVRYYEKKAEERSSKMYTTMPEIVYDIADTSGGSKIVRYDVIRYGGDTDEPGIFDYMSNIANPFAFTELIKDAEGYKKGAPADLNCYESNKWSLMYYTKDRDAGSPICEDETGTIFKVVQGDQSRQNGYEPLTYFGERTPGNTNSNALKDKYGGIYISYRTEASIKDQMAEPPVVIEPEDSDTDVSSSDTYIADGDNTDENTQPGEDPAPAESTDTMEEYVKTQETVMSELPADSGYISEVIVETGKDSAEAKAKINKKAKKFYIVDTNLTPQTGFATYIAYSLTENKDQAVRDIRVAPYVNSGDVTFGDISYGCSGAIGVKTDKNNSTTNYPCDGLFYTTDKRAGTPLRADSLHIVNDFSQAREGWEPVTVFSGGLPYDFNQKLRPVDFEAETWRTLYYATKDNDWSEHKQVYVYYEPETMFVGGEKYLSGMFFVGGYDFQQGNAVYAKTSQILDLVEKLPNVVRLKNNLQKPVQGYTIYIRGEVVDEAKLELYLCYSWSYNPYRALYDVTLYEDIQPGAGLPFNLRKARSYDSITQSVTNASRTASQYDCYVSCSAFYQYYLTLLSMDDLKGVIIDALANGEDYYYAVRSIVSGNGYMSRDSLNEGNPPRSSSSIYTKDVDRLKDVKYKVSQLPDAGLYVEGCTAGKYPLRLSDVVISSEKYEAVVKNGELSIMMPAEDTLADTQAEGSFKPVCDCKDPNSLVPVDLSYPVTQESAYSSAHQHKKDAPVYIYVKGTRAVGKYISKVFVGSMSRQLYKDNAGSGYSSSMNDRIDQIAESSAIQNANAEASDEVILCNISRYQSDCWYNFVTKDGYNNGMEYKKDKPASYLAVARTDNPDEAITGLLLFKDEGKSARSTIKVSGASYYCASSEMPVYINGEKYFLYYTYNTGVSPGKKVTNITIDNIPMISKCATVLMADERDPDTAVDYSNADAVNEMIANYAKPYGDPNMPSFIHLDFDSQRETYYNNLYIGTGVTKQAALCDLLSQGCVEFCDIDLNHDAGGFYVYLGYRSFSIDYSEIDKLTSALAKKKELNKKMNEAIYDIVCTEGEEYQPDGFVGDNGAYYYPVSEKDLNAGTTGEPIYMYYCSTFRTTQYNNKKPAVKAAEATKVFGSDPITQIAFARYDRVPYYGVEGMGASPDQPLTPWEYVLRTDNKRIDLNHGAFKLVHQGNSYRVRDTRISMFVQREKGTVKPAGEITGGFYTDTTTSGNLYYVRG